MIELHEMTMWLRHAVCSEIFQSFCASILAVKKKKLRYILAFRTWAEMYKF